MIISRVSMMPGQCRESGSVPRRSQRDVPSAAVAVSMTWSASA
jgi:hypothetical protein